MSQLSQFYRIPKINIKLPSNGNYYPADFIKYSMDGSLPIRAMTAIDERLLKSPDALLNGDCVVNIIKSCCPEISEPRYLLAPDIEAILLGIFYASLGPTLKFNSDCPTCKHNNEFELEIRTILALMKLMEHPSIVTLPIDLNTKLEVFVKPYTFETNNRHQLTLFQQSKMLQVLSKEDIEDEVKLKTFNDCFEKIVNLKFQNLQDCIIKFNICELINNEWLIKEVSDKSEIKDFIFKADKNLVNPILDKIDILNKSGIEDTYKIKCQNHKTVPDPTPENPSKTKSIACDTEWEAKVEFNPVNFFVQNYNSSNHLRL